MKMSTQGMINMTRLLIGLSTLQECLISGNFEQGIEWKTSQIEAVWTIIEYI